MILVSIKKYKVYADIHVVPAGSLTQPACPPTVPKRAVAKDYTSKSVVFYCQICSNATFLTVPPRLQKYCSSEINHLSR